MYVTNKLNDMLDPYQFYDSCKKNKMEDLLKIR